MLWRKESEAFDQRNTRQTVDDQDLIMSDSEDSSHVSYEGNAWSVRGTVLTAYLLDRRIELIKQQRRRAIGLRSSAIHSSLHRSVSHDRRRVSGIDLHSQVVVRSRSAGAPFMCQMVIISSLVYLMLFLIHPAPVSVRLRNHCRSAPGGPTGTPIRRPLLLSTMRPGSSLPIHPGGEIRASGQMHPWVCAFLPIFIHRCIPCTIIPIKNHVV